MLHYLLWGVGILVGVFVLLFMFLLWNLKRATRAQEKMIAAMLAPIDDALRAGNAPSESELTSLASVALVRRELYRLLLLHHKVELFPKAYLNRKAMAESDLVRWLAHANELNGPPDAIELVSVSPVDYQKVTAGGEYYLFRFMTNPPHWAAKHGWMAGIAGPYRRNDDPVPPPAERCFSELEAFDSKTPIEHVRYLHEKITQRLA